MVHSSVSTSHAYMSYNYENKIILKYEISQCIGKILCTCFMKHGGKSLGNRGDFLCKMSDYECSGFSKNKFHFCNNVFSLQYTTKSYTQLEIGTEKKFFDIFVIYSYI